MSIERIRHVSQTPKTSNKNIHKKHQTIFSSNEDSPSVPSLAVDVTWGLHGRLRVQPTCIITTARTCCMSRTTLCTLVSNPCGVMACLSPNCLNDANALRLDNLPVGKQEPSKRSCNVPTEGSYKSDGANNSPRSLGTNLVRFNTSSFK